jgi:hypothetical protein
VTIKGVQSWSNKVGNQKGGGLDFSPEYMPLNIGWRSEARIATKQVLCVGCIRMGPMYLLSQMESVER